MLMMETITSGNNMISWYIMTHGPHWCFQMCSMVSRCNTFNDLNDIFNRNTLGTSQREAKTPHHRSSPGTPRHYRAAHACPRSKACGKPRKWRKVVGCWPYSWMVQYSQWTLRSKWSFWYSLFSAFQHFSNREWYVRLVPWALLKC